MIIIRKFCRHNNHCNFPASLQIVIGTADRHKWYSLTPRRRKIGKAVARKSFKSVANHSWDNEDVRPYLKKRACREIQKELKAMCSSSSVLSCSDVNSMKTFA